MNDKKKSFYYVWSPQGTRPRVRHENFWAADNEARRLATTNPGNQFVVLESKVAYCVATPLQVTEFDLNADIPF